ncbi:MAG: hypothetical protein AAGA32_21225 [Pseudomonadota bacterium]
MRRLQRLRIGVWLLRMIVPRLRTGVPRGHRKTALVAGMRQSGVVALLAIGL